MNSQLLPVEFHGDTVVLADFEGQPYVVMRTMATNLGLSWPSQYTKLVEKFGSVVLEIVTTGADGKQYPMVCLPLRKLPAWLYTLQPNKVKPQLRDKMARYQDECDEVLYRYWTSTAAGPPAGGDSGRLAWLKESSRLTAVLEHTRSRGTAQALWRNLQRVNDAIGIDTEAVDQLAPALRQQPLPGMAGA